MYCHFHKLFNLIITHRLQRVGTVGNIFHLVPIFGWSPLRFFLRRDLMINCWIYQSIKWIAAFTDTLLQFCVLTIHTLDGSTCNLNKQSKTWIACSTCNLNKQSKTWIAFEPSNSWIVRTKNQMFQFDCIWSRFWIQQTQFLIIVELEKMAFLHSQANLTIFWHFLNI